MKKRLLPLLFFLTWQLPGLFAQGIIYVDASAGCPGNGNSWGSAYCELQTALENASPGSTIWVAAGTYQPDRGPNNNPGTNSSFVLRNGVTILGGFEGNESEADERDWEVNQTILSGNIDGGNNYSTTVVRGADLDESAVLDGFIIQGGRASTAGSWSPPTSSGANMYLTNSSPVIRNCIIRYGIASYGGGVTILQNSSPAFFNVEFHDNYSSGHGGAIHMRGNCEPTFVSCHFEHNYTEGHGGAIHCRDNNHPVFTDCHFISNGSNLTAGAIVIQFGSTGHFEHCHFENNQTGQSTGAVHFNGNSGGYFFQCHFINNHADNHGGALGNHDRSKTVVESSFFRYNTAFGNGGSVRNTNDSDITLTEVSILDGQAAGVGGGIWNGNNGLMALDTAVHVSRTRSLTAGGGIANTGESTLIFKNGILSENKADKGGGLYSTEDSPAELEDIFFLNNEAANGGGIFLEQNESALTSIRNCTFNENTIDGGGNGGAIYSVNSRPVNIFDSEFNRNTAPLGSGGGLYFTGEGSAQVAYSVFYENEARHGGSVAVQNSDQDVDFYNCIMSGNTAAQRGGAIALDQGSVHLTNNLLSGNRAQNGGAFQLRNSAEAVALNTTIGSNLATENAGGIALESQSEITLQNTVLFGNGASGSYEEIFAAAGSELHAFYSCIDNQSGNTGGQGAVTFDPNTTFDDPNFAEPLSPNQAPFTSGDFRLLSPSSAIDVGNNQFIVGVPEDLDGNSRIINDVVDMGAYERAQCVEEVDIYLCRGKSWNGIHFDSDTSWVELIESSSICDSVLVTNIHLVDALEAELDIAEEPCTFDSTFAVVSNPEIFNEIIWSNGDTGTSSWFFESGTYEVETADTNGCRVVMEFEIQVSSPPEILLIDSSYQSNPIDPDGSISIEVSGGHPPYTYQWDGGSTGPAIDGLAAGIHCVTVTDAEDCENTDCFELGATFELLEAEISKVHIKCPGDSTGEIELTPTGGYPVFEVVLNSAAGSEVLVVNEKYSSAVWSGLPAGDYVLTISDSIGQHREYSISLTAPSPFELHSAEIIHPLCYGDENGSLSGMANGGTPPYQMNWFHGLEESTDGLFELENLASGTYSFELTDSLGCSAGPFEFLLEAPDSLDPQITYEHPHCPGMDDGWVEVEQLTGGTPPFSVMLDPFDSGPPPHFVHGLPPGTYPLLIEDSAGCRWRDTLSLEYLHNYQLSLSANSPIELGDTIPIQVTTDIPNIEHADWTPDHLLDYLSNSPLSPEAFPFEDTEFILHIVNSAGCHLSDSILIEVIPSPEEVYIPNAFSPNEDGINDRFTVYAGKDVAEIVELTVFDRWGSKVWTNRHFRPNDAKYGWDGYFRGKKLQSGIYAYTASILFKNGTIKEFSGDLLLIE